MRGLNLVKNTLSILFAIFLLSTAAHAESQLPRLLDSFAIQDIFPGATRAGTITHEPVVAPVYQDTKQLGYVFLTSDYVNSTGYSGKPIHQIVAIDMQGVIRKVTLVEHHEPIVLIGIPESRITAILKEYEGMDVGQLAAGSLDHSIDVVSGATVTVIVMDDNIQLSSIKVARHLGLAGLKKSSISSDEPVGRINPELNQIKSWQTLFEEGSIGNLKITIGEINQAFEDSKQPRVDQFPEDGDADEEFINLHAAMVSIPSIGRSLLGEHEYRNLQKKLKPGEQAILIASNGRFSFKGSGYVRGGIFDRFQIIQDESSLRFHDNAHKRLRQVAAEGAPEFTEVDLFRTPAELNFNPARPWTLELLVGRDTGPSSKAFLTFDLNYHVPQQYLIFEQAKAATGKAAKTKGATGLSRAESNVPIWKRMWELKLTEVIVLLIALAVLSAIFFFQDWLVKRPQLNERVRIAYLLFTLVILGWVYNAQLSVVNILAMFNALVSGFNWDYFLMEPLIFILWGSVAAALLFWGRGPYCGWLCPFGALQELLNKLAKKVRIKQVKVPWLIHERVWSFKYLIFLLLFGVSLYSLDFAERLAEVEPFKTSIILKFVRDWPYVLFALAVLIPGLFIERFYCRYLCPLGAALAIPGRLRMFAWLKRYRECGSPCQRCANECMVQAIHPEGNIDVNECLYCLHCQQVYYDDHACPVMIQKRLKRERSVAGASKPGANPSGINMKSAITIEVEKPR